MAIKISQGFKRTSNEPIDETLALTKAQMKAVDDSGMPEKYFTICQDDGKLYLYDKENTVDEQTGKFRILEGGSGGESSEWGVAKVGITTVTFNNSKWSTSSTIDVSDLGFKSGSDYEVLTQPVTGGTVTPWGSSISFIQADKGATSFRVSAYTMEDTGDGTINAKYIIFAKGYGGGSGVPSGGTTGQVLTKKSDADKDVEWKTVEGTGTVDTEMSDTSENAVQNKVIKSYIDDKALSPTGWGVAKAGRLTFTFTSQSQEIVDTTIDISELGLTSANDYEVQLTITGGGTMDWGAGDIFSYEKTTTRIGVTYRNISSSTKDYAIVDYVIIAKGYGGAADAQWGHISGTLTNQTDLVNYINENGGKIDTIKVNNKTQDIYNKTVGIDVVDLGWESDKTRIMNKGGVTPAVEIKDVADGVELMFGKGSEAHKTFVYKTLVDKEYADNIQPEISTITNQEIDTIIFG